MKTYFIQSSSGGPIKIGRSMDSNKRLRELQTSHASKLEVLVEVDGNHEPAFHSRFRDLRLQGEWFRCAQPLVDYLVGNFQLKAAHKRRLLQELTKPVRIDVPPVDGLLCDHFLERDRDGEFEEYLTIWFDGFVPECECDPAPEEQYAAEFHDECCARAIFLTAGDHIGNCEEIVERAGVNQEKQVIYLVLRRLGKPHHFADLADAAFLLDALDNPWGLGVIGFDPRTRKEYVLDAFEFILSQTHGCASIREFVEYRAKVQS
jgi:Meiotically up-regulated gene 113